MLVNLETIGKLMLLALLLNLCALEQRSRKRTGVVMDRICNGARFLS